MDTMQKITHRLAEGLMGAVFPVNCLGCEVEGDWICGRCQRRLSLSNDKLCVICGKAASFGLCQLCRQRTKLDGAISLFAYNNKVVQNLVKQAKYRGYHEALKFIIRQNITIIRKRLPVGDWQVTFIPVGHEHLKTRGFNQAEIIAKLVADRQLACLPSLTKKLDTESQASLNRKQRLKNLKNSMAAKFIGHEVVICDDVITTGSTMREAVRALRKAGATRVFALTIAHG